MAEKSDKPLGRGEAERPKIETRAISAGRMSDAHFGAVNTPVYRASTILYPDLAALGESELMQESMRTTGADPKRSPSTSTRPPRSGSGRARCAARPAT